MAFIPQATFTNQATSRVGANFDCIENNAPNNSTDVYFCQAIACQSPDYKILQSIMANDLERKHSWNERSTILANAWRDYVELWKTSSRIYGLTAEI
jgi:hypothetical protein